MPRKFVITGVDVYGKRFKIVTESRTHMHGINLYRGTKWVEEEDGKRKMIVRVYN